MALLFGLVFVLLQTEFAASGISDERKRLGLVIDGKHEEIIVSENDDLWSVAENVTHGRGVKACDGEIDFCRQSLVAELLGHEQLRKADRGCPSSVPESATTRILVAVPSAARNVERREWIRETWCRRAKVTPVLTGGRAGVRVAFFVGIAPEDEIRRALEIEALLQGDIVVLDTIIDAATNVTAKLLGSLAFFARLENYTHYVRAEDDVYLFADRLAAVVSKLPVNSVLASLANGMLLPLVKYPRGFGVIVPGFVARGLGLAVQAGLGDTIIHSEPNSDLERSLRPPGAKGAWMRGHWWCDDEFFGVLLYPWNLNFIDDSRLHDLPGRGPMARRVSHASIAVNAVQSLHEFLAIHTGNTSGLGVAQSWHRSSGASNKIIVPVSVDGTSLQLSLHIGASCPLDATSQATELCQRFPNMPSAECQNAKTALLAVCDNARLQYDAPLPIVSDWTLGFAPASSLSPASKMHPPHDNRTTAQLSQMAAPIPLELYSWSY